jgi:hypothetical protein
MKNINTSLVQTEPRSLSSEALTGIMERREP